MASATYAHLTQSKYFHPAFNSAIFDGPFRIYFAQSQEPIALNIYFTLQKTFGPEFNQAKRNYKDVARNVLIMVYPNADSFEMAFEVSDGELFAFEHIGTDAVLGLRGPVDESEIISYLEPVISELRSWPEPVFSAASL